MSVTYRQVQEQLREVGILMSKRGGTIRINYFAGLEVTAYYTDDLEKALVAGMTMARPNGLPLTWCASRIQSRNTPTGQASA